MTERRRGLGRGLGALIPTDAFNGATTRPRDVFFRDHGETPENVSQSHGASNYPAASARAPEGRTADGAPHDAAIELPADAVTVVSDNIGDGGIVPVPGASFALLPVSAISPNPRQPREIFDEDELAELVHSIKEVGVLQPVVVRPLTDPAGSDAAGFDTVASDAAARGTARYELVMGERRWRASRQAGQEAIPAIIRVTGDDAMLRDALLENLHRTQLNPLEEAAAYQQLLEDFGCTHEELAATLGRSRPQISNLIRLLKLPPLVQRRVAASVLSAGHARALLALPDAAAMERLAQRIVAEGLSVRSVEEIVALGGEPERTRRRAGDNRGTDNRMPELDDLAAFLADRWDTRVSIALGRRKGRLTVEFASVEDLNRILDAIGERPGHGTTQGQLAG